MGSDKESLNAVLYTDEESGAMIIQRDRDSYSVFVPLADGLREYTLTDYSDCFLFISKQGWKNQPTPIREQSEHGSSNYGSAFVESEMARLKSASQKNDPSKRRGAFLLGFSVAVSRSQNKNRASIRLGELKIG